MCPACATLAQGDFECTASGRAPRLLDRACVRTLRPSRATALSRPAECHPVRLRGPGQGLAPCIETLSRTSSRLRDRRLAPVGGRVAAAARPTLARIALIDQLLAAVSGAGKRGDAVRCGASFFDLALGCIAERESG